METIQMSLTDFHINVSKDNVSIYYKGPFTNAVLAELSRDIRAEFYQHPQDKKKLFSIFMELAQNISYYSAETTHFGKQERKGIGVFMVLDQGDHYKITAGNMVKNDIATILMDKAKVINSMGLEELRKHKIKQRNISRTQMLSGGNIGLIQVAICSRQRLDTEVIPISNEYSYFLLSIVLNKTIKQSKL